MWDPRFSVWIRGKEERRGLLGQCGKVLQLQRAGTCPLEQDLKISLRVGKTGQVARLEVNDEEEKEMSAVENSSQVNDLGVMPLSAVCVSALT